MGFCGHSACDTHDQGDVDRRSDQADLSEEIDAAKISDIEALALRNNVMLFHGG